MAQLLRVLAASPKDRGSILSTHMAAHDYLIDYSCRGSDTSSGSLRHQAGKYCLDIYAGKTNTQNAKKSILPASFLPSPCLSFVSYQVFKWV